MSSPFQSGRETSPFEHVMTELVKGDVHIISGKAPATEAAAMMEALGIGSLVVMEGDTPVGILTKTDLVSRVLLAGREPSVAVKEVASGNLIAVEGSRPIFDGLMLMVQHDIGHLLVMDNGRLAGIVSERDWLTFQGHHPAAMIRRIEQAGTIQELAALRERIVRLIGSMFLNEGTAAGLAALVTHTNDRVVRRVIELTLHGLRDEAGDPPVPFAWIAMGSEGREEQTLATDQDNGLVFQDVPPERLEAVQGWFLRFAARVVDGLEVCGFPRCKGNVMASNPDLCQPLGAWRDKFSGYLSTADEEALLRASIYFDFRCIHGDASMVNALWDMLKEDIRSRRGFLRHLAGIVMTGRPPVDTLGWKLRRLFGLPQPPLDLKKQALAPLVAAARVMALAAGSTRTNTLERLEAARDAGRFPTPLAQSAANAYDFLMLQRLRQNLRGMARGRPPSNTLHTASLNPLQRRFLLDALRVVMEVQDHVMVEFGGITQP